MDMKASEVPELNIRNHTRESVLSKREREFCLF